MKKEKFCKLIALVLVLAIFFMNISMISLAKQKTGLNKKKLTLNLGHTAKLKVQNSKKKVKWFSNKKSIVTVNTSGKITAKRAGTAKITAKTGKKKYVCKVTVPKQYINKKILTLPAGSSKTLKIYGVSKSDKIYWGSDNRKIATVTENGTVTAESTGKTVIYAMVDNGIGKIYECEIYVSEKSESENKPIEPNVTSTPSETSKPTESMKPTNIPDIAVTGVELMETNLTLDIMASRYLSANVLPLNAANRNVTWQSTNDRMTRMES